MADWRKAFEVVNTALGVINSVGSTPGINLIPYVSTVAAAAAALKAGLSAGVKVSPYVMAIADTFSGDGLPSQAKLDALNMKIAELESRVDAPLPPKEAGEED